MLPSEVAELLPYMTAQERAEINRLLAADGAVWRPLPGPQSMAYHSTADVVGYGGAAGGGKTDLACGKALTQHRKVMMLRREATQLTGILDRLEELLGSRDGHSGRDNIWRLPGGRQVEFGSVPHANDAAKYQGRPHDLLVFDEAANFLESQVRFLLGWVRTTVPGQRCQALLTFNPPTTAEGRWLIDFFAPWLDRKHPTPAKPGELRYVAVINGKDHWLDEGDARPFVLVGDERVYDFDPKDHAPTEVITPKSRTFVPSRITDNPYLMGTGYMAQLQSMPEPLRSQMLNGDFMAGVEDDPWQVIPTAWIEAAMARWAPKDAKGPMDSMGVDVARGGRDHTVIARRHGVWFDKLVRHPGHATPNGPATAGLVIADRRDRAPVHVDVIGWGSAAYDFLVSNNIQTVGVNGSVASVGRSKQGNLAFYNLRAELHWRMREALDPLNPDPIALPPDSQLLADLAAPKWWLTPRGIQVEEKEEIKKRIGRSPDDGDAVILANISTVKHEALPWNAPGLVSDYDPLG